MNSDARREELKKFLRARRAALSPDEAGLRATGRRRTPGLRREEVAALAGISVTWYTWLEQARDIQCSPDLLFRLGHALRLSQTDTEYFFKLAGHAPPARPPQTQCVDASLQAVFDRYSGGPALATSPRLDVLACNAFADAVFHFDEHAGTFARNQIWRGFMDPRRRRTYVDWEDLMSQAVALLRANYATRIGDEAFEELIGELTRNSADFTRMWNTQRTAPLESATVRLRTGDLGQLNFVSTRFALLTSVDHVAFFLSPADDETARAVTAWLQERHTTTR